MYPWTIPEALAVLPKELGIGAQTAAYIDYYGSRLETTYIQSDIAFQYNSYMGANFYLEFIYYLLAGLIALNFIRRLLGAFVRARLPSPLRRLRTAWIKHFYLSAAVGSQSSGPVSPLLCFFGLERSRQKLTRPIADLAHRRAWLARACDIVSGPAPRARRARLPLRRRYLRHHVCQLPLC